MNYIQIDNKTHLVMKPLIKILDKRLNLIKFEPHKGEGLVWALWYDLLEDKIISPYQVGDTVTRECKVCERLKNPNAPYPLMMHKQSCTGKQSFTILSIQLRRVADLLCDWIEQVDHYELKKLKNKEMLNEGMDWLLIAELVELK